MATWARPVGGGLNDAQAAQSNAETDPTGSDGMNARGTAGYTFWAEAAVGQTFTAGVVFEAWIYDAATGQWARASEADITVGAAEDGLRRFAVSFTVASPRGRRCHVWDGTGPAGPVTTTYTASLLTGESDFG